MTTDRTRPRQPLSPDMIEDMLARRRNGESLREIASVYGYTSGTAIRYILKDRQPPSAAEVHAIRQAHGQRAALAARNQSIAADRAAGETLQAIGDRYGLTRERVRQIASDTLPPRRPVGRRSGISVAFSGDRLAAARTAAGLSQTRLAERLGTHHSRISEWERGLSAPRPSVIPAIAAAVGIDALELVGADLNEPELKSLRLAAGLSLQALAAAAETTVPRYRRLELGSTRGDSPEDLVLSYVASER